MGQPTSQQTRTSGNQQTSSPTTGQQTTVSRQEFDQRIRQWMQTHGSSVIARETREYNQKERRQSVFALVELNKLLGVPRRLGTSDEQYSGAAAAFATKCISGSTECEVRKGELIEELHHTSLFSTVPQGIATIGPDETPQLNMSFGQIRPRNEQNFRPGLFYSLSGVSFTPASSVKQRSDTGRQRIEQIEESGRNTFEALETTTLIAHLKALGKEPSDESDETTYIAAGSIAGTHFFSPTFRGQDQESVRIDDPLDSSWVIPTYGASTNSY